MKLAIYVMHVPVIPEREATLAKLLARAPSAQVMSDPERRGAWWNARRCWEAGIASGADWIVVLNDDALPCEGFEEVAAKALAARSARDPVCFFTNHPEAASEALANGGWYTTHDGLVGVGCALSSIAARRFLSFCDNILDGEFTDDGRINLFAMYFGLRVHTTVPSLVDHQLPDVSLVGNEKHGERTAVVPPSDLVRLVDWTKPPVHAGRMYNGNHWELARLVKPETLTSDVIEHIYLADRHGEPVDETPHVVIATPAYSAPVLAFLESRHRVVQDLAEHGIKVTLLMSGGDSLVTRGRHALCHQFLQTTGTHLLFWDADIECIDPATVRHMLAAGKEVVGGAYPFRDGSGAVVANALPESKSAGIYVDETGCARVREVGTGFMLIERKGLVRLMAKHPETLYFADTTSFRGQPMWALFDVAIEERRYLSEDWLFCRRHGDVYVYVPAEFRHYGMHGHSGHIMTAWGMRPAEAAE